KSQVSV
ncbi:unnamed protein product, partial [Allacma fusca]